MDAQKGYSEKQVGEMLKDVTEFERAVYLATFRIPMGKVSTYGRIAAKIGKPKACRAVANALHNNPLHPIVPCQRVVQANGGFGGRQDHAEGRRKQLVDEGVPMKNGRIVMSDDIVV
ncbi:MAG TPA: MGMT family protein [Thermoplasmata archaeon]